MLSLARRLQRLYGASATCFSTSSNSTSARRKNKFQTAIVKKVDDKTEQWVVDDEMHKIGENIPLRERFVIPRDNLPNKRCKRMREQFMHRTRLVLNESEHEPWCKRYMELYQELRENWERLYWDEGYSKKLAQDHANYESVEDDDLDFSPYRRKRSHAEQNKDLSFGRNKYGDTWEKVGQIWDKFEHDREKGMREKEFALDLGIGFNFRDSSSRNQPFDAHKYFFEFERDNGQVYTLNSST
uniref:Uncharacterized protein n=1 Tax=Nelumbo nucifera TaxID=4432 RepID=A0A822XJP3_NELNU|nr:TPA_asm: hypothetical protein HUJ06_022063 [Nelumbo nucifera]